MRKRAVQLLILSMLTTALLVGPVVTQANATTNSGKKLKQKQRIVHQGPAVRDPNANPFASKYEDDFDRKNAGGGGGY
jgi:hypothetical protein